MEDGKSSLCLLVPILKRRKVSAIRDFPKGLKQFSDVVDLESRTGQACGSLNEYLKANGLHQFREGCRIVVSEEKGVHQSSLKRKRDVSVAEAIRDYPKEFKRFHKDIDPKLKWDEFRGTGNMKELKRYSEEVDPKAKGDEACRSKNSKPFKGSCEELYTNVKEDRTCRSKNESLKPVKLHETSIESEREVDYEEVVNQFGTEQQCGNGDKNNVSASEKKPLYQNFGDISRSDVTDGVKSWREEQKPDSEKKPLYQNFGDNSRSDVTNGVKSWREEQKPDSEQDVDHCSFLEQQCASNNGNVLRSKEISKCQDNGSSFNACNLTGVTGNMHRTLPKRRKVSAVRVFPPALVRISFNSGSSGKELLVDNVASTNHLGMVEGSSSNGEIMIEPKYGINDVEIDGQSSLPDEPSLNMEKQEFYHPSGHSSAAMNDVQESSCQLFGPDDMFHLAPADTPNFFSDDCYNGFLFENDFEPSKTCG